MSVSTARFLPELPPEVGDLVQVRSRRWLVEEVAGIGPGATRVKLACAEDDAQGRFSRSFGSPSSQMCSTGTLVRNSRNTPNRRAAAAGQASRPRRGPVHLLLGSSGALRRRTRLLLCPPRPANAFERTAPVKAAPGSFAGVCGARRGREVKQVSASQRAKVPGSPQDLAPAQRQ